MRTICSSVGAACLALMLGAMPATGQTDRPRDLLSGISEVDIAVQVGGAGAQSCGLSEDALRPFAVNSVAPSGLRISGRAPWTISFHVVTAFSTDVCVSAISSASLFYGHLASGVSEPFKIIFMPGNIDNNLAVNRSARDEHRARIGQSIRESAERFVSHWREVNSGSPLVARPMELGRVDGGLTVVDVRDAQRVLQRLGYYTGAIDGSAGPATRSALMQFQRANGLVASGELNEATLAALRSR